MGCVECGGRGVVRGGSGLGLAVLLQYCGFGWTDGIEFVFSVGWGWIGVGRWWVGGCGWWFFGRVDTV